MIAKFKVFEKLSEVGEEVICIKYLYFIINDMGFEDKFL